MKDYKLTERQRVFAGQHYDIMERFLINRGLPFEEFYDVVVFEFLDTVKNYGENSRFKSESFESIAVRNMCKALEEYIDTLDLYDNDCLFMEIEPQYSYREKMNIEDNFVDRASTSAMRCARD